MALDAANIQAHAGVELERHAARRRLRVAEHDADLLAQLVGEDQAGVAGLDDAGQLAQRLAHQPRLQAHVAVAHLAFDLGTRHQRRHTVDHHHIHGAGAHQRLGDLQRLLAGVRLADVEVVDIDADLGGVGRVQGVFDIDKAADAAHALRLGDHVQADGRLAGAFRAVDLDDAPTRHTADAQRDVQAQAAGGDRFHIQPVASPSFMTTPSP